MAIIDDLGAIVIIAFFYSGNIQSIYLVLMLASLITLICLNRFKVTNFLPYLIIGIFLSVLYVAFILVVLSKSVLLAYLCISCNNLNLIIYGK